MPCFTRMKRFFLQGLLWLHLIGFGVMALSLEPGFLDFDNLPDTNFSCVGKVIGGYYADLETNCQMFHVCTIGQLDEPMDIRFLCLNGTVFDQETRVCERIDEVDCSKSEQFYSLNLELYGNTQPSILEETPETDAPLIIKKTTSTSTTTTTPRPRPRPSSTKQPPKSTRPSYFTTSTPPSATTLSNPKVISSHHFPLINSNHQQINPNSPDIRFNPEEINISLNPGAPPNIRTKPLIYHPQSYSDNSHSNNKKVLVTAHSNLYKNNHNNNNHNDDKSERISLLNNNNNLRQQLVQVVTSTTQRPSVTPSDINYGFTFRTNEEQDDSDYQTENPPGNYHYEANFANLRPPNIQGHAFLNNRELLKTSTYRSDFTPTTKKYIFHNKPTTTFRSQYFTSLKPLQHYNFQRTEKPPQRLQLPLPLLPTLSPLTFSTPAPFSLSRHIETKRYTNDHQAPPRIIISASASVSDGTGRKLNYSLGTIGTAHLLEQPPSSYDEYKDDDVGLDPFYHDVPKINNEREKRHSRKKRESGNIKPSDVIKSEQEAVDVLKFLFDWYKDHEARATTLTIPVKPEIITQINDELGGADKYNTEENSSLEEKTEEQKSISLEEEDKTNFKESALFKRKSKFNIVGDVLSVTEDTTEIPDSNKENVLPVKFEPTKEWHDYVDDNYEPSTYKEAESKPEDNSTVLEKTKITHGHYITKENSVTPKTSLDSFLEQVQAEQQPNNNSEQRVSEETTKTNNTETDNTTPIQITEPQKVDNTSEAARHNYHTEQSVITSIQSEKSTNVSHGKRSRSRGRGVKKFALNNGSNSYSRNQRKRSRVKPTTTSTTTTTTTELPPLETITFESTTEKLYLDVNLNNESDVVVPQITSTSTTTEAQPLSEDYGFEENYTPKHHQRSRTRSSTTTTSSELPAVFTTENIQVEEHNNDESHEITTTTTGEPLISETIEIVPPNRNQRIRSRGSSSTSETSHIEETYNEHLDLEVVTTTNETPSTLQPLNNLNQETRSDSTTTKETLINLEESFKNEYDVQSNSPIESTEDKSLSSDLIGADNPPNSNILQPEIKPRRNSRIRSRSSTTTTTETPVNFETTSEKFEENIASTDPIETTSNTEVEASYTDLPEDEKLSEILQPETVPKRNPRIRSKNSSTTPISFETTHGEFESEIPSTNTDELDQDTPQYSANLHENVTPRRNHPRIRSRGSTTTSEIPLTVEAELDPVEIITDRETEIPSLESEPTNSSNTNLETSSKRNPRIRSRGSTTATKLPILESIQFESIQIEDTSTTEKQNPSFEIPSLQSEPTYSSYTHQETSSKRNPRIRSRGSTSTTQLPILEPIHFESIPVEDTTTTTTTEKQNLPFEEKTDAIEYIGVLKLNQQTSTQSTPINVETTQLDSFKNYHEEKTTSTPETITIQEEANLELHQTSSTENGELSFETTPTTTSKITDKIDKLQSDEIEYIQTVSSENLNGKPKFKFNTEEIEYIQTLPKENTLLYDSNGSSFKFGDASKPHSSNEIIKEDLEPPEVSYQITPTEETTIETTSGDNYQTSSEPSTESLSNVQTTINPELVAATISTQMQKFIEEIESNTNSIAAVKITTTGLGEVTTLPSTVKIVEFSNTVLPVSVKTTEKPQVPNSSKSRVASRYSRYNLRSSNSNESSPRNRARHRFNTEKITSTPLDATTTTTTTTTMATTIITTTDTIGEFNNLVSNSSNEIVNNVNNSTTESILVENQSSMTAENVEYTEDVPSTDPSFYKSANPTQENPGESLPTTPLSKVRKVQVKKEKVNKNYIFNCFGKEINKFYSDPRDCRLFHYCTRGYNKNQLLDMKFVCDLSTYFDDEKLICTKKKPLRCL